MRQVSTWPVHLVLPQIVVERRRTEQRFAIASAVDDRRWKETATEFTEATEEEAALIARSGASMALCSGSIAIIDGIVPPAHAFRQAGGKVALGSDQACGNNCNNVFNEIKLTALLNKVKYRDPTVMPAWEVLRMATINGARALGLDEVGYLAPARDAPGEDDGAVTWTRAGYRVVGRYHIYTAGEA